MTILVAEDDQPLRDMLRKLLLGDGYKVLIAKDGLEAMQLGGEHQDEIDMLISDVQMPGMSGQALARDIIRIRPNLPVLLVSGQSESVVNPDPAWSFLQKPYFPRTILDKIREMLIESRASFSPRHFTA